MTSTGRRRQKGISREEERELVTRFQAGNRDAGAALLEVHRGLIAGTVRLYRRVMEQFGIPFEDAMQEAQMGFLHGIRVFDLGRAYRAPTYALYWVRAYVGTYVREQSGIIRIPNYIQDEILGNRADESDDKIRSARSVRNVLSLDQPANGDADGGNLLAAIEDREPDVESRLLGLERAAAARAVIAKGLQSLTPREREVLTRRYMAEDPESLEAIGDQFSLTRERIRQIEGKAKARFRRAVLAAATPEERAVLPPQGSTPFKLTVRSRRATPVAAE